MKSIIKLTATALFLTFAVAQPGVAKEPAKKKEAVKKEHGHKAGHDAHVHGVAKLSIALEDNNKAGTILLESPGDSIIGFEHEAKSAGDKKTQEAALAKLTQSDLYVFDKSLVCSVSKKRIEVKKEEHDEDEKDHHDEKEEHHGEHNEVEAEYSLSCQKSATGSTVQINLGKVFPKIKQLQVQVLKNDGQSSNDLKNGTGSIKL